MLSQKVGAVEACLAGGGGVAVAYLVAVLLEVEEAVETKEGSSCVNFEFFASKVKVPPLLLEEAVYENIDV